VDFYSIEACCHRIFCGIPKAFDDVGDFFIGQFVWHDVWLLPIWSADFVTFDFQRARSDRLRAAVQERVAGTTAMPKLEEDFPPSFMYGFCGDFPTLDPSI